MREERFRIQCPEHFQVGDSGRFEKPSQDKESDFVVDYAPPEMFEGLSYRRWGRREIPIAQCMSILPRRNTFRFIWTA